MADQCPALAGLVGAETDESADADHVVRRFVDGEALPATGAPAS